MQWLAFCAATSPFLSVQNLVLRYCEHRWIGTSRHFRFWGFRYSFWKMLCNYSRVGFDV